MGKEGISVDKAVTRAKSVFPGALSGNETFRETQALKQHLHRYVQLKLDKLEEKKRLGLMERRNASDLCISIGMSQYLVERKFQAVAAIESSLGYQGKLPILQSVYHLINTIDTDSPFGSTCDGIETNYKGKEWLMYLGVPLQPLQLDDLDESIKLIQQTIQNYDGCFMHGSTASTLQEIYSDDGNLKISGENTGNHDFGDGLYCFRGHFRAALSFAVDRSWPLQYGDEVGRDNAANAAVIIFPDGPSGVDGFLNTSDHVLTDNQLRTEMGARRFNQLATKMDGWDASDINWKRFVKVARSRLLPFLNYPAYFGILHNCDTVAETDKCSEPVPDRDRWTQYCFRRPDATLGDRRLFVELFIDWDKWIADGASREDVDRTISGY